MKKIQMEGNPRGYKAQLARAAHCQPAYLSQVLKGTSLLTLEQIVSLCEFWNFGELETDYLMTLTELSRAGTPALQKKLRQRLASAREQSEKPEMDLSQSSHQPELAFTYYLDWTVSAVHIMLTIPGYRDAKSISKKLGIDEGQVFKALSILKQLEIASQNKDEWALTSNYLHATQQSLFSRLHHRNWRDKVREKISLENSLQNYHFTSVVSLSRADFQHIRDVIAEMVQNSTKIIRDSKEERLACLLIDWFEV